MVLKIELVKESEKGPDLEHGYWRERKREREMEGKRKKQIF